MGWGRESGRGGGGRERREGGGGSDAVLRACVSICHRERAPKKWGERSHGSQTPGDPGTPEPSTTNNCWPSRAQKLFCGKALTADK